MARYDHAQPNVQHLSMHRYRQARLKSAGILAFKAAIPLILLIKADYTNIDQTVWWFAAYLLVMGGIWMALAVEALTDVINTIPPQPDAQGNGRLFDT